MEKEKKFKLICSKFLLPLNENIGLRKKIETGFVLIEDNKIKDFGDYSKDIGEFLLKKYKDNLKVIGTDTVPEVASEIPILNGLTMPGFVKAHGHDHESPIIGIAKDEPLTDWLDHAVNLFTGFMNENSEKLKSELNASPHLITYLKARLDDIFYGITACMVHHCNHNKYHVDEIVKANLKAGTKMIIAVGSQDRNYDPRILDSKEAAIKRLDNYYEKFKHVPYTSIIPGPDQFFSNGPELLQALKQWAIKHETLIHIHSSEEPETTKWFTKTYGMTPVKYANSINFLDENTILAHQVNCTENDLKILQNTGTKIVHNPLANTILGSGMPPVVKMLDMGIPVAISTDGSGSADHQNMIMAAKLASQYQKAALKNAKVLTAQEVLEMITVIPAKFLKLQTGQIRKGFDADIIFLDFSVPNLTPTRLDNVVENLIWCANGSEVTHVIANGKLLVENKKFLTLDENNIKKKVLKLSELMMEYKHTAKEITGTGVRGKEQNA